MERGGVGRTPGRCARASSRPFWLVGMLLILCAPTQAGISNCKKSTTDTITKAETCIRCLAGYSLSVSKLVCTACPSSCLSCGDNNMCLDCDPGRYPLGTECVKCSPQCVECGTYGCKKCQIGYSVNSLDGTCIKCIPNCYDCENSTGCIQCATSFDKVITEGKTSCESSGLTIAIYIVIVFIILICLPFTVMCTCWELLFGKLRVPRISKILAHDPNIQVPQNMDYRDSAYISHIQQPYGQYRENHIQNQQERSPLLKPSILELRNRNLRPSGGGFSGSL